ncbi:MAG: hypothetical protein ABSG17_15050 [Spirochaetia bacterium]|jgi:hypothetical protein
MEAAQKWNRHSIGVELNRAFLPLVQGRVRNLTVSKLDREAFAKSITWRKETVPPEYMKTYGTELART